MSDPTRPQLSPDQPRPAPRAPRPSLRRTIVRVAAVSVTGVALVWSGLTMSALATRHTAATTAPPALSAAATTTTTTSSKHQSQAAPTPAPVTTKTS